MLAYQNKLIVALDSENLTDSRKLTNELGSLVSFYKIGFIVDNFVLTLKLTTPRIVYTPGVIL